MGEVLILPLGALYLAPTIVAAMRRHRQLTPILALNILLGWTVVGWAAAFVWALQAGAEAPDPAVAALTERQCPHCAETIKAAARVCRYCGRDVEPGAPVNPFEKLPSYHKPPNQK